MFDKGTDLLSTMPDEEETAAVAARRGAEATEASGVSMWKRRWYSAAERADPRVFDAHAEIWFKFALSFLRSIQDPLDMRPIDNDKNGDLFTHDYIISAIAV